MKKVLISALVAAMCVGFGAVAFAATPAQQPPAFSDIAGHEAEAALTLLGAMGVYTGDSGLGGAVKPDDSITRAQFCKVIVTAMGRATTAAGLAGLQPTFTDGATIPTWAWGFVNVAVYMGIINGYADGSFGPNNPVTYAESVTMLIRAVPGHVAQVMPGVWPYNYLFYGVDEGFTGGVDVGFANLPASRGDVAQMTVATMQKEKADKDGLAVPGTAQLYVFNGDVWNYDANSVYFAATGWTDLSEKYWVVGAADLEGLRNLPVAYVYNSPTVFFLAVTGESNAVAGVFDELDDADDDTTNDTIVLEDGTKVPFTDGGDVDVTWNQNAAYGLAQLAPGDDVVITLDDDGLAVNVQATHFEAVDWITVFTKSVGGATPVDTNIDTNNTAGYDIPDTCLVYLNGAASGRDNLAVDDAILTAFGELSGDPFVIKANREAIEGTVTGTTETWPGNVVRISIDLVGGGSKTYVLNDTGGIGLPGKDDKVNYGLDFDGAVYVPIGFETLTPYVVCTSYVETGAGDQTATFDVRGVATTYKVAESYAGYIGEYMFIQVDLGTGTVLDTEFVITPDDYWKVVSVDAVNGTLTLSDNGDPATYLFIDDADLVVYDEDQVYVGLAGLAVGDWVFYDTGLGDPVFEITDEPI